MVLKLDLVFKMLNTLGPVYTVFRPSKCVGLVSVSYLIFILELFYILDWFSVWHLNLRSFLVRSQGNWKFLGAKAANPKTIRTLSKHHCNSYTSRTFGVQKLHFNSRSYRCLCPFWRPSSSICPGHHCLKGRKWWTVFTWGYFSRDTCFSCWVNFRFTLYKWFSTTRPSPALPPSQVQIS